MSANLPTIGDYSPYQYYVATYDTTRGPWVVVDSDTGKVVSEHDSRTDADNAAYRLDKGAALPNMQ